MKKSTLFSTALLAAGIAFAPAAHAAEDFAMKAAKSDAFEIQESQLAVQNTQNPAIKQFAQQMIADHTKSSNDLKAAAPAAGVTPAEAPMRLDDKHAKMVKALSEKTGKDFDKQYVSDQQKAHKQAVSLFEDYAKDGNNAELKSFAQTTLPTLKMHKDMADKLDKSM